jgi:hypothetical protein
VCFSFGSLLAGGGVGGRSAGADGEDRQIGAGVRGLLRVHGDSPGFGLRSGDFQEGLSTGGPRVEHPEYTGREVPAGPEQKLLCSAES